MGKTCFFIGHREAPDRLFPTLSAEVERHIAAFHVTEFVVGGYGHFDTMASCAVINAKKRHSNVTLFRLLPYHPSDQPIPVPPGFDGTFYPPNMEYVPKKAAIIRANRIMIASSDYLIAYVWHSASNAMNLVNYAMRCEKQGGIHVTRLNKV